MVSLLLEPCLDTGDQALWHITTTFMPSHAVWSRVSVHPTPDLCPLSSKLPKSASGSALGAVLLLTSWIIVPAAENLQRSWVTWFCITLITFLGAVLIDHKGQRAQQAFLLLVVIIFVGSFLLHECLNTRKKSWRRKCWLRMRNTRRCLDEWCFSMT